MQRCLTPMSRYRSALSRSLNSALGAIPIRNAVEMFLRLPDLRVAQLSCQADTHRVVRLAELHHVYPIHREEILQVLHRRVLLDHHR